MIIKDLYEPNADSLIRELKRREQNIKSQFELARDGGDFQQTLEAYLRLVSACVAEVEALHAVTLAELEAAR
ncbi:hypothetical protein [Paracoccus sp. SM22M-07]|uniref:hypothetical protein n=1 Tax=Paracoccus sp. SM22M-07 TaxID=1520813 RepID=UPI00091FB56C|nr:hypothetical protein [Paracoccus sp. SM22M-07]OJH45164.1 hypothetical protein IE00_05730 [Paracoccus sp. SM22M-07]